MTNREDRPSDGGTNDAGEQNPLVVLDLRQIGRIEAVHRGFLQPPICGQS